MKFFLSCICLFFMNAAPAGVDAISLARANAFDRKLLQNMDPGSDIAQELAQIQALYEREQARKNPAWIQQNPETDTTALNALWKQKNALETLQFWKDRIQMGKASIQTRMEERGSRLKELEKAWTGPRYRQGTPTEGSMIAGTESLPNVGGPRAVSSGPVCGIYDLEGLESSATLQNPVPEAWISAGTWEYPEGGLHLGLDLAAPLYANVFAPANGIVLYTDTPVDTDSGYLGNWSGFPAGGGNTILLLCPVENELLAISLCHLSDIHHVLPGQQVAQGQLIALSGNSGNSTGPHTHMEVIRLDMDLQEAVETFMEQKDFTFGNGYSQAGTCSPWGCRMRPESYLGME